MQMAAVGTERHIVVVGAGIVGLSAALHLLRAGCRVTLLDAAGPGEGASFGNGGLISVDAHAPVSVPGMLRQVWPWLRDPTGPVSVPRGYALKAAPWLMRWVMAGRRMADVHAASAALRALHRDAYDRYRDMLGADAFRDLFRQAGLVQVWSGDARGKAEEIAREMNNAHGIETQDLTPDDLRQLFPGIAGVARGLLFPRNGHTVSPARVTAAIADAVRREGGDIRRERVLKLVPREGGGFLVLTGLANHVASAVVVAGGAWSKALVAPLGVVLPLETERGYHLELSDPSIALGLPIIHKSRGFCLTPMSEGLRLAGTVEIAGLSAPPNEARALLLRAHAEALFPGLAAASQRIWMGFRPTLPDSVPAIGPVPGRSDLIMAVGHGHYGMIGGPATGRLVAELVTGARPHVAPDPYAMTRFMRA